MVTPQVHSTNPVTRIPASPPALYTKRSSRQNIKPYHPIPSPHRIATVPQYHRHRTILFHRHTASPQYDSINATLIPTTPPARYHTAPAPTYSIATAPSYSIHHPIPSPPHYPCTSPHRRSTVPTPHPIRTSRKKRTSLPRAEHQAQSRAGTILFHRDRVTLPQVHSSNGGVHGYNGGVHGYTTGPQYQPRHTHPRVPSSTVHQTFLEAEHQTAEPSVYIPTQAPNRPKNPKNCTPRVFSHPHQPLTTGSLEKTGGLGKAHHSCSFLRHWFKPNKKGTTNCGYPSELQVAKPSSPMKRTS